MSKVFIASDHGGFEIKTSVIRQVQSFGHEVIDLGPSSSESADYPDFADQVCRQIKNEDIGILICGSGQGMAMRANKYPHIRAALCWNKETAHLAREHNNANILCLGARTTNSTVVSEILGEFFHTEFAGGRHLQRVAKVSKPV
jgi:ribose 5-phosphate isomerase B